VRSQRRRLEEYRHRSVAITVFSPLLPISDTTDIENAIYKVVKK
jgi:hypothetical protein